MSEKSLSQFALLLLVRDSHIVRNAERQLLDALIMRSNPKKRYICWPSYHQLSEDTNLSPKTLRRAAVELVKRDFVMRKVRANRSNVWFINAALIQKHGEQARNKDVTAETHDDCPFTAPELNQNEYKPQDQATDDDSDDFMTGGGK